MSLPTLSLHRFGVVALLVAACAPATGSRVSAASAGQGTYAEKCEILCSGQEHDCGPQSRTRCRTDCESLTEGLPALCAQCMVEQAEWTETTRADGGYCAWVSVGQASGNACKASCYGEEAG